MNNIFDCQIPFVKFHLKLTKIKKKQKKLKTILHMSAKIIIKICEILDRSKIDLRTPFKMRVTVGYP